MESANKPGLFPRRKNNLGEAGDAPPDGPGSGPTARPQVAVEELEHRRVEADTLLVSLSFDIRKVGTELVRRQAGQKFVSHGGFFQQASDLASIEIDQIHRGLEVKRGCLDFLHQG